MRCTRALGMPSLTLRDSSRVTQRSAASACDTGASKHRPKLRQTAEAILLMGSTPGHRIGPFQRRSRARPLSAVRRRTVRTVEKAPSRHNRAPPGRHKEHLEPSPRDDRKKSCQPADHTSGVQQVRGGCRGRRVHRVGGGAQRRLLRSAYLLAGDLHRARGPRARGAGQGRAALGSASASGNPTAYARTIIVRDNTSWWRRQREAPVPTLRELAQISTDPEAALVVRRALDRLTPKQRAVLCCATSTTLVSRTRPQPSE